MTKSPAEAGHKSSIQDPHFRQLKLVADREPAEAG
jgi:hypothetical protein